MGPSSLHGSRRNRAAGCKHSAIDDARSDVG
jgi:hypothetical protein